MDPDNELCWDIFTIVGSMGLALLVIYLCTH